MAYCPQCNGELPATAAKCVTCGYDFPSVARLGKSSRGFEFSSLADFILIVSTLAAMAGASIGVVAALASLIQGEYFLGLVVCPIATLLQLGLIVVFLRVQ